LTRLDSDGQIAMEKPHILIFTNSWFNASWPYSDGGGVPNVVWNQAQCLIELGYSVTILYRTERQNNSAPIPDGSNLIFYNVWDKIEGFINNKLKAAPAIVFNHDEIIAFDYKRVLDARAHVVQFRMALS
jgi:hypothetical protein